MATRPSCGMPWLTPMSDTHAVGQSVFRLARQSATKGRRTLAAGLEEPRTPLDLSMPPNVVSFPIATGQSTLHEPVSAEVVSVLGDLVPLLGRLLLRCSIIFCFYVNASKNR